MPTPLRISSDEWAFFFPYIKYTFVVTQIATKSWIKNHHFSFVPDEVHGFCTAIFFAAAECGGRRPARL